jgi:predicted enzyme related to lactoylglutathione lyase
MPERTEYLHGTPNWVDLQTTDPAAAKTFYSSLFGWTYDDMPTDDQGGVYSLAQVKGKDVAAIAGMPPGGDGIPPHWNSYVSVSDVDAATALVEPAGGSVIMAPFDVLDAGRMALIADPTGAIIALWQAKNHIGAGLVNDPNSYSWNELLSPDVAKAGEFYNKVLGWTVHPVPDGSYTEFKLNGDSIAGGQAPPMPGIPPVWTVYFSVDDTDQTIEKIKQSGGAVMAGPIDIPIGRLAVCADPQGAMFNVIKFSQG